MAKCKTLASIDDGIGSDDSHENYAPRQGFERIEHVPNQAISVAQDGRIRSTFSTVPIPASPSKKKPPAVLNLDVAPPQEFGSESWQPDTDFAAFDAEYGPGLEQGPRKARPSDDPNEQWTRLDRETFHDELIRHDGRGDHIDQASCAGDGYTVVCLYIMLRYVSWSTVMWNGAFFKRCTLKSLGLRNQLGHTLGDPCPNPATAAGDDFVVVNSHTIDEVGLDYCNCSRSKPHAIQLLRMCWYPATGTNPRSAAMFAALNRFNLMSLESKCSAYEFYNSLAQETDNTGLEPSRERYEELLRMTRQWQNLHLLKRAGRGHDPAEDRIGATKEGECALLCPACPQPGKNLPTGWENVPLDKEFLYALFITIDTNFCLKRRDVSSEDKDPGLGNGWLFFGEVKKYMAYLGVHWDQKQESTCVAHDTVDKPDRESLGTASSGIGTVDCARHNMKRPSGVGDLQKGERLAGTPLKRLYVSYDIACQWHKNIAERMKIFDSEIQFKEGEKFVVFLVPKFHLPVYIELCNLLFSFNLTPYVGRTDGEAPERGWADANRLSNSTSVSGPGARRDALDIHFQDWNWKKIVGLGRTLLERIQKNTPLMLDTREAWVDMETSMGPAVIDVWMEMAVKWEEDARNPNPFESKQSDEKTLKEVRCHLAEIAVEDVEHLRVRGDMHNTEMMSMGLKLEEQQRALATHVKQVGAHETVDQGRRRIEHETKLRRKIDAWMAVQQLFIPEVALLRDREDMERRRVSAMQAMQGIRAQDMKLWLPSSITRRVQCDTSLYMDGSLSGVRAKTRSATRTKAIGARLTHVEEDYRTACTALVSLGAMLKLDEWQQHLLVLNADDVRLRPSNVFGDEERQKGGRRKKQKLDAEALAREAETRARGMRYREEVDILEEEMRRVVQFLDWHARWWRSLEGLHAAMQPEAALHEGHAAYAEKQAGYMEGLSTRFQEMWKDVLAFLEMVRAEYAAISADDDEDGSEEEHSDDGPAGPSGWLSD
ncbi:hypothetical protein B0H13DRAFT_1880221 [Mycena leptocephala]|nr:hypothetical protein B0H13DRAFT_1880221 [Mycena leptocephala]